MADYILLAGISDYRDKYLSNLRLAHRDAQNLHGLFRHGLGFGDQAILLPADVSLRDFNRQFNEISQRLTVDDRLIIYFSGHGYQHGDEQYLLLSEAETTEFQAGQRNMHEVIAVQTLKARLDNLPISQSLFMLDTCRNGPPGNESSFLHNMISRGVGLAPSHENAPPDHQPSGDTRCVVLNACGSGEHTWELPDGGVFVKGFERTFAAPLLRGETIWINAETLNVLRQQIALLVGCEARQTPSISPRDGAFELRSASPKLAHP